MVPIGWNFVKSLARSTKVPWLADGNTLLVTWYLIVFQLLTRGYIDPASLFVKPPNLDIPLPKTE